MQGNWPTWALLVMGGASLVGIWFIALELARRLS